MEALATATRVLAESDTSDNSFLGWATALVTLVASLIAARAATRAAREASLTARLQTAIEKNDRDIAFYRQQLNELYGPIYMSRRKSERLYDVLRDEMGVLPPDQEHWRLVDNIQAVKNSGKELAISSVENILAINAEIEELLKTKWGLLETHPPHDTFIQFMSHTALLKQAWEKGVDQAANARTVFPRDIDKHIKKDMDLVEAKLGKLTS